MQHNDNKEVNIGDDGVLRLRGWICVPNVDGLKEFILKEAHSLKYYIHPGAATMQKSYIDSKACDVVFMVSERVFLRFSPLKGVMRFRKKGKFSSRYIDPFEVLERVGEAAHRLALPPSFSGAHLVFHISMLWKYFQEPLHVLDFSSVQLDKDLTYDEELVAILDRQVCKLRLKNIALVKVQWSGQPIEKETW
ncbi:uncharacterized protein [Nicotiana tomentosiformis]|uniref:uncharacterized protein n=1 Tax=Nicotiana tomentosiformis TaxID=4098 RepID=UPI00388C60BB